MTLTQHIENEVEVAAIVPATEVVKVACEVPVQPAKK